VAQVVGPHRLGFALRASVTAASAEWARKPYAFPYTGTTAPRVTRLSGDARNRIVAATSSTSLMRRDGKCLTAMAPRHVGCGTHSPFAALQRFGLLSEGLLPCGQCRQQANS